MISRKIIMLFFFLFSMTSAIGGEIKISVQPESPVMGESFNIVFKVITEDGTDPIVSFEPQGIEVLGKQETGISTKTTYINGKLTVERSITIVYEVVAQKSGTKYLRRIVAEVNGKKIKHRTYPVRVLSQAKKAAKILAVAIVDKESAFVGESILVRYYLYSKVQVSSTGIKKFPKLDKFLKRFHQESNVYCSAFC